MWVTSFVILEYTMNALKDLVTKKLCHHYSIELLPPHFGGFKNIDDRNCLKPVYGKYVLSQLVSKVNNFPPNLPNGSGHLLWRGGG